MLTGDGCCTEVDGGNQSIVDGNHIFIAAGPTDERWNHGIHGLVGEGDSSCKLLFVTYGGELNVRGRSIFPDDVEAFNITGSGAGGKNDGKKECCKRIEDFPVVGHAVNLLAKYHCRL